MITKRLVTSLLFVLAAATSSLALAQPGETQEAQASAFPHSPVGSPNIE